MPVLRLPTDDTLGTTLGNLGASLANNLNPMNMLRGQELLQEMQQQRFELQRQQQLDAANANAAEVYGNANPHGLSPADLEVAKSQIRNGNFNPAGTIEALKAAGGYAANQVAASMIDATHPEWSDGQRASAKADILSGRKNLSEVENDFANVEIATNKSTATIGATNAARSTAGASSAGAYLGPLAAEAAATGDAATAGKIIAQGKVIDASNLSPDTPITSPTVQDVVTQQAIGGLTPPAGQAPLVQLQPQVTARDVGSKIAVAAAAPRAPTAIVPGVQYDANGNVITPAPPALSDGATPLTPPLGSVTVQPVGPNPAATAASAAAETGAQTVAKARNEDIQSDIDTGKSSQALLRNIALLRQYSTPLDNTGVLDQGMSDLMNKAFESTGITFTAGQSARNAFQTLAMQMIADARKDAGVQRLAGPEISALMRMLPNAAQDRQSLEAGLDNFETKARIGIDVGDLARKTMARSSDAGVSQPDYINYQNKRAELLAPPTQDKPHGTPAPAPPTPAKPPNPASLPAMKFDPASGKWLHLDPATGAYLPR